MSLGDWEDLRYVLAVVRAGSLTGAARELCVDQSTVTRRVKALEDRLDLALFEQLRRGIRLTPAGETFFQHAEEVEERCLALERALEGRREDLVGTVRLALPDLLAVPWLREFRDFAARHQRLDIELVAGYSLSNLSRREADVALRVSQAPAEHLVGRRVGKIALCAYAHADLARTGVAAIPWIDWSAADWPNSITRRARERLGSTGPIALEVNTYLLQVEAVRQGVGASVFPCILGDSLPDLVRLDEPQIPPHDLWVLTHPDLRRSPRIRAISDWLSDFVLSQEDALLGRRPA